MLYQLIRRILPWILGCRYVAYLDPTDNSVTFSPALFKKLKRQALSSLPKVEPKPELLEVFTFYMPTERKYGFTINPPLETETQLGTIQYNTKHKSVGFPCLSPPVSRILYDYGYKWDSTPVPMRAIPRRFKSTKRYYYIFEHL